MARPATIALDGPVAVGKNAIGTALAGRLGYRFFDTGAMYRALTWLALKLGLDLEDESTLSALAAETSIELISPSGVLVNGQEVGLKIRAEQVEKGVSLVARVAGVRRVLVARQQQLASGGGVVMAGRDIGTVVLPQAELKIYLAASAEERARRRFLELQRQGKAVQYKNVLAELELRDKIDSERSLSPLQPAPDARIVVTDGLNEQQVLSRIMGIIEER